MADAMTMPVPLAAFADAAPILEASVADGAPHAIDAVAEAAAPSHRFLRRAWYAAALEVYGGVARTLVVREGGAPVLALPFVRVGPAWARAAQVPGCYWPFRSVPVADLASPGVADAALDALGRELRVLRFGPVYDGDPALEALRAAARRAGWAAIDRRIADSYLLDVASAQAEGPWPRTSTLKKNRFHEKHLAGHGVLEWSFVSGEGWTGQAFDDLAAVEEASWIAARTDGGDAKFTRDGHGAFWRAAAADPVIAVMMWAAVLRIDGKPAAFSFDLNAGALKYAIANSYDPAFAKHSPGKLLYYRNLVRALADGIARVDWGAGDSGYKRVIGAEEGPTIRDWLFVRSGPSAAAARLLKDVWRRTGN
jgi:CelD/BcsL family acetyltransferase involved in cellulose biosynthesis